MGIGSAKYEVVVSSSDVSVPFAHQFDLDDAMTMPDILAQAPNCRPFGLRHAGGPSCDR
ncbi:hypothetical protein F3Y22_tig00111542pilonHSYRG00057 [Hibiscus syriacus]|uniref:Uncharacterized protein n=1 Tax=Hibiscus syriacus TaxID=106335 RepID=A0A6A2YK26_HIBSY|nr:hypothetical protein F3Y22_tig00111542pilonHSYRG00057 [Hibiscus syriacus]